MKRRCLTAMWLCLVCGVIGMVFVRVWYQHCMMPIAVATRVPMPAEFRVALQEYAFATQSVFTVVTRPFDGSRDDLVTKEDIGQIRYALAWKHWHLARIAGIVVMSPTNVLVNLKTDYPYCIMFSKKDSVWREDMRLGGHVDRVAGGDRPTIATSSESRLDQ